jgi:dephospho-CoA kinase
MKVIGLCGGSGSGKGTASSIFMELGIPSIDTDMVYREMTCKDSPCMRALKETFGEAILNDRGGLDRAALGEIVFHDSEKLRLLNKISHRFILEETRRRIISYAESGYSVVLVDAPVLFESGFDTECDEIICVLADNETRVDRIMRRDGITEDRAIARINSQMSNDELLSRCNYVIYNDSDVESLRASVSALANTLLDNKTKGE